MKTTNTQYLEMTTTLVYDGDKYVEVHTQKYDATSHKRTIKFFKNGKIQTNHNRFMVESFMYNNISDCVTVSKEW
tara:strand:+ start:841 stop:1065 length:225 start_codon:yes stop_codon:yes gene_type:complete